MQTLRAKQLELNTLLVRDLVVGCSELGLVPSEQQILLLCEYLELLSKWNTAYNLTAVRDPAQMVSRHVLDSLALCVHCEHSRYIDVGTGAGLPGIPLAIMFPDRKFDLLDSNGKKTRFLFQAKTALALDNVNIHHSRVEIFQPVRLFDVVISRAYASLFDMVMSCRHLVNEHGRFYAMKGVYPNQEISAINDFCDVKWVQSLTIPGLDEQRHLVSITLR